MIEYFLGLNTSLAHEHKTKNGRTPLHTACLHGHLDVVKLFASKLDSNKLKKMMNVADSCGNIPFSECILADHLEVVKYLLENFGSFLKLNHRDSLNNSFIHLTAQSGSIKTLQYLFDRFYGAEQSPLKLIERFSNDLNRFKMSPLHSACKVIE